MMKMLTSLLGLGQGTRTYWASTVLAALGGFLFLTGKDSTLALALLAQGGGLAALRSAVGRVQAYLNELEKRLNAAGQ